MTNRKRMKVRIPSSSLDDLKTTFEYSRDTYLKLLKSVHTSTVEQIDDDKLNSSFQNSREVDRDRSVTNLLSHYVDAYEHRQTDNRQFRKLMFILSQIAVYGLILTIIASIVYSLAFTERNVNDIVALVTACISSIGSIAFLLDIIARYVFPSNEEDHIAQMVQAVQKNDLEERKLRYEHQKMLRAAAKESLPVEQKVDT